MTRLRSLGRQLRLYLLADGLAVICAAGLAAIFITLLVDRTFWLAQDMRATQLLSLLLVLAWIARRFVWQPLQLTIRDADLAVLVEQKFPHLDSRLVSAVEFAGEPAASQRSQAMMRLVIEQAERAAADLRFTDTLAHARFRRSGMVTLGCVVLIAATCLAAGPTMSIWFRRNVLLRSDAWPQHNRLSVEAWMAGGKVAVPQGGKVVVPRGDDLTINAAVEAGFAPPRQAFISYTGPGGLRGREQMPQITGEAVRFEHVFERIQESLQCIVAGGDATPVKFNIEVLERPQIRHIVIAVQPPAYTRLEQYELRAGQTVAEALPGSRILFHIQTNRPVRDAELMREGKEGPARVGPVQAVSAEEFVGTDTPKSSGTYFFQLRDETGLTNVSERSPPVRFAVRLVPDKPPKVTMRIKGAGEMITQEAILPIETDLSDQYGLASAALVHQTAREGAKPTNEPLPGFEPATKTFSQQLSWAVGAHGLKEGERVTLHAEARDADDVSGPNLGKSSPMAFRIVSREELLAELNRREQEYRQDYERMIRQQEDLYAALLTQIQTRDVDAAQRSRQFRQLSRQQRDQTGRLNTLRLQFEQVLSELRISQLADAAVEERLGNGVIHPLERVARTLMPQAADALDSLAADAAGAQAARDAQDRLLKEMNTILASMLKWERFQEAVSLLREVLKMQRNVNQETEKSIEGQIFGTNPATAPSKP